MNHNILSVKDIENCPGFGFFPTEECLSVTYLAGKNSGQAKKSWPILEIDLCAYEPGQLLGLKTAGCDNYKYFFNRRRYADERNKSYIRRTKTGYWKLTGNPRKIKGGGTKRSLVFYEKETIRGFKPVRTGWIIQEYDNGGEYVIAKLQIKNDKIKKSKSRRRQNVPADDFTEDSQIVNCNSEFQNVSTDDFAEDDQTVYRNAEVQNISTDDFTEDDQTVYRNADVQNISTDDFTEGNQTYSHDSEDLTGFEYQNSSSTESGFQYQSPAISSDLEYYNPNAKTADDSASPNGEVQNGKNMNITMSACNTGQQICQEGFSYETENQFSTNESEDEQSSIIATPYSNSPNAVRFDGEGAIFSPDYNVDWSLHSDLVATNLDQNDWFNDMMIFFN